MFAKSTQISLEAIHYYEGNSRLISQVSDDSSAEIPKDLRSLFKLCFLGASEAQGFMLNSVNSGIVLYLDQWSSYKKTTLRLENVSC